MPLLEAADEYNRTLGWALSLVDNDGPAGSYAGGRWLFSGLSAAARRTAATAAAAPCAPLSPPFVHALATAMQRHIGAAPRSTSTRAAGDKFQSDAASRRPPPPPLPAAGGGAFDGFVRRTADGRHLVSPPPLNCSNCSSAGANVAAGAAGTRLFLLGGDYFRGPSTTR